jgi:hypothetical protein
MSQTTVSGLPAGTLPRKRRAENRVLRLILQRRVRRHRSREQCGEDVGEVALRLRQVDDDRPAGVVRDDAADVAFLRAAVVGRADDAVEERGADRVELVVALDRGAEVARAHWRPVRVLEAAAQRQRVGLPVRRDGRQAAGQVRDEGRARAAGDVAVPEQRQVHVPHHSPALGGVREARVEVVDPGVERDPERREGAVARRRRDLLRRGGVAAGARGREEDDRERDREQQGSRHAAER